MHRTTKLVSQITAEDAITVLEARGYTITAPALDLEIPIILSEAVPDGEVFLFCEGRLVGQIRTTEDA